MKSAKAQYLISKMVFLLMTILLCNVLQAQNSSFSSERELVTIKELTQKLQRHKKNDTIKVHLLNDLNVVSLENGMPEKAFEYGFEALHISRKIKFDRGIALSFTNIGHTYSYNADYEKALKMFLNALHVHRKLKQESAIIDIYVNIGTIYDYMSNYAEALKYYMKALNAAPNNSDYDLLGDIHLNLGITFGSLGNHNESLDQLYKALRYYEKNKDKMGIADTYNSLGNTYAEKADYKSSLKMYRASLRLFKELDDPYGIANEYVNLGILFTEQNKLSSVKFYYNEALAIYIKTEDIPGQITAYNSLGLAHYKLGEFAESETAFITALEKAMMLEDREEIISSKIGLSRLYTDLKNQDLAKKNALEALDLSQTIHNKAFIRSSYDALLYVESKARNFEKAFQYQQLMIAYKDSINNEETTKKGMQIALTYSFQKKADSERVAHERTVASLNLQSQKNNYIILFLILIIVSVLVVGFFARRAYYNRKRLAKFLENENTHKEMLLQEVHHRVNNSLQMISSLLSIQADSTDNEEIREYLHKSENRLHAMSVMHQLLHLGNSKLEVDMNTYLGEVLSFYNNLLESKPDVKLHFDIPSVLFHTKTAMPLALILNELITNSLKYAFPENQGEIEVSLKRSGNENEWIFAVNDNGVGFDANKVPSDSGSLGLSLVNLMTRQIEGKIVSTSSHGALTEIRFKQKDT